MLRKTIQKLGGAVGGRLFISTGWTILLCKMIQNINGGLSHNWFISTHWTNLLGKNGQKLGGGFFLFFSLLLVAKSLVVHGLSGYWSQHHHFCNSGHSLVIWQPRNVPMACPVPGRKISFVKMAHLLHENSEF